MIVLGIIIIALTVYDRKNPNSIVSRFFKRITPGHKNVESAQISSTTGIGSGVIFILIGVVAIFLSLS
ncbi:hypothetical protein QF049_001042 [Paenibacillus sp. W4I10]|nr:hypothetical protein [Paenibacillus sp. W4I10]